VGNKTVYGIDWNSADKVQDALNSIPEGTDILVAHQVWEELMGDVRGCEASFANVPTVNTVFTGDFHQNKVFTIVGRDGQTLQAISPGSTNFRKINEPVDKFFYVLKSDYTWAKVRIPTRRRMDLRILTDKDFVNFEKTFNTAYEECLIENQKYKVQNALATPLCRVEYHDNIPGAYDKIKQCAQNKVELFLKQIPPAAPEAVAVDRSAFKLASGNGLLGMVGTVLSQDDRVYKVLSRLLVPNADLKTELLLMKKERGL
jgi:hypothetical protein